MGELTSHELHRRLAGAIDALHLAEERAIAGRLALEIMHEIKNPLEALSHLTFLTLAEADEPEKVRGYMLEAEEQMAEIRQIASQTLGVARQTSVPKMSDLAALTEAAIRIHQKTIAEKKIHLVKDMTEGVTASVYTSEILQVISNLIVNALDALPPDGMLCLRVRKRRDEVHLVVADTGHGIDSEHCANIFKPFFTTKEERGTGLGLALSKKIVERHRGRISMRSSVQPGKSGTIFRIALPA